MDPKPLLVNADQDHGLGHVTGNVARPVVIAAETGTTSGGRIVNVTTSHQIAVTESLVIPAPVAAKGTESGTETGIGNENMQPAVVAAAVDTK